MTLTTLKGRDLFGQVFKHGKTRRCDGVTVYFASNNLSVCRYGVAAKTSTGNAVVRNRVRRWARQLLSTWQAKLKSGFDIVILAHSTEASKSYRHFAGHLATAMTNAELNTDVLDLHN